jgi:amino acid transporter
LTDSVDERLPRELGFWGIWLLAVNGMVGSGIFGVPGEAARLAGDWAPLLYLGSALLVLPILLCFGELASRYRNTGGPMNYATDAFGPFVGFQTGWLFYLARVAGFAAGSVLLIDSVAYFWPTANVGSARVVLLAVVCFAGIFLTLIGSRLAIRALGSLTALKFAVPLVLVVCGLAAIFDDRTVPPVGQETLDLGAATLLLIYAFVGFESAVVPAGEARRPERDMPWALLLGLGIVGLLYFVIQWISQLVLPDLAASTTPLLDVAAMLLGPAGALMLMSGVLFSVLGTLVGAMFSTPRITYAFALDGRLPDWFGRVHPKFLTPANSILVYGGAGFLLAVTGSFIWLAVASVLMRLLMYIVVCLSVLVLRRRSAAVDAFTLPGGVLIPLLGVLACGWLLMQVSRDSVLLTLAFIVAGSLMYWLARRRRSGVRIAGRATAFRQQ